jgi:hypothetical protein
MKYEEGRFSAGKPCSKHPGLLRIDGKQIITNKNAL